MIKIPTVVWVAIAGLVLAIIVGLVAYNRGGDRVRDEWDASIARGQQEVARLKAEAGAITTVTETKVVYKDRVIYEKGKDIIKTVEVFVPADNNQCMLDAGFRVFHDASANNAIPDPTQIANAAPVHPQTVATTVAENYTGCHRNAAKLIEWQQWALEQCRINGCDYKQLESWLNANTTDTR